MLKGAACNKNSCESILFTADFLSSENWFVDSLSILSGAAWISTPVDESIMSVMQSESDENQ